MNVSDLLPVVGVCELSGVHVQEGHPEDLQIQNCLSEHLCLRCTVSGLSEIPFAREISADNFSKSCNIQQKVKD